MAGHEDQSVCPVCQSPATNKCGSCKLVTYCSKEHQKEDWKVHKEACRAFQTNTSSDIGRYLEATRAIAVNEAIFTEAPLVFGPTQDEVVCLGCYKPAPTEKCSGCMWPVCSTNCPGLVDPNHHAAECAILKLYVHKVPFISDNFYRYEAVLPLRCLLLQKRNPKAWRKLLELQSHIEDRGPKTEAYKRVQEILIFLKQNYLNGLKEYETSKSIKLLEDYSDEIIQKVCGILDVNALDISLPCQSTVTALYATASMLEHSCLPNTRHVFEVKSLEFKVTFTAAKTIVIGDHISTMYTHALWGTQQRQNHLRSNKYFTCKCARCADPTEFGTFLSALKCLAPTTEKKKCGGYQLPLYPLEKASDWKCNKCPTSLTSGQVLDLVNMIGDEVDHVQASQPTIESLQTLLEKLRKLLHPNHFHCYGVMHSLIQLYGRQPGYLPNQINNVLLEKKIEMCNQLQSLTETLDPTSARLPLYAAVIYHELHNSVLILAKRNVWTNHELSDKLQESRTLLSKAITILEPEEKDSPGEKVREIVSESLIELEAYAKSVGVKVTT